MKNTLRLALLIALTRPLAMTAQTYCAPTYINGTAFGDYIDGVQFGDIMTLGTGGIGGPSYIAFGVTPPFFTVVEPYDAIPMTINTGNWDHGVGTGVDQYSVWMDMDHDGAFALSEKVASVEATTPGQTLQFTVNVPGALHGCYTRMRVMCTYDEDPNDACGTFDSGETEDYTLIIDNGRPCIPVFDLGADENDYIEDVEFGDIHNIGSGAPAAYTSYVYGDTARQTTVLTSFPYPLTIRSGANAPVDAYDHYTVWVDLDHDGTFSAGEKLASDSTNAPFQQITMNITIPERALVGYTWMRVLCTYGTEPVSGCGEFVYGEAEDYTVIITDGETCIPTFTHQAVEGDYVRGVQIGSLEWYSFFTPALWGYVDQRVAGTHLQGGTTTQMTVTTGTYAGTQYVYVWLDSNGNGIDDNDLQGSTTIVGPSGSVSMAITVPEGPRYARLRVACTREPLPNATGCYVALDHGNVVDFTLAIDRSNASCLPLHGFGSTQGEGMSSVQFDGGTYGTSYAFPYYTFNNGQAHALVAGQSVDITIAPDFQEDQRYLVAMDMNDDGMFDPATEVLADHAVTSQFDVFTLPLVVPETCLPGQHTLRVRGTFTNVFSLEACSDLLAGEIVDILVQVREPDGPCIPYCDEWTTDGDYISGVRLGSLINEDLGQPYDPAYIYFALSTDLMIGVQDTLTVTSGAFDGDDYAAWIDLNNDHDFDDAGEQIGLVNAVPSFTPIQMLFTVPSGTPLGHKRMRVRCWDLGDPGACTEAAYGQIHDYDVNIVANTGLHDAMVSDVRVVRTDEGVRLWSDAGSIGRPYTLLDAMGRALCGGRITSDRTDISMLGFADGAYSVLVTEGDARVVKRFVW